MSHDRAEAFGRCRFRKLEISGARSMQPFVDAMCAASGVRHVRTYETVRDRAFDFVFVSVKTYDLPAVKAELDAHGIAPRIAILVHNGIVPPMFPSSVRVVIPQSYDFVETPGEGCGVEIHVCLLYTSPSPRD